MKTFLFVTQIVLSLLLSFTVLVQQSKGGLSETFGGSGDTFHATKRGAEKVLFYATIIFSLLFVANSVAFLFV